MYSVLYKFRFIQKMVAYSKHLGNVRSERRVLD